MCLSVCNVECVYVALQVSSLILHRYLYSNHHETDGRFDECVTQLHRNSPLSHCSVVELFFLLDVSMVCAASLATLALVTAEDGGQLLLGYASWRQRDGTLLSQTPTVLQEHTGYTHTLRHCGQAQASTAFPHSKVSSAKSQKADETVQGSTMHRAFIWYYSKSSRF